MFEKIELENSMLRPTVHDDRYDDYDWWCEEEEEEEDGEKDS